MSVQNQTVKNVYAGNGSTTVFPFTFALLETDGEYVGVYITNDVGISEETDNFTIDATAKTVTYPKTGEPLPTGKKIVIRREIPNEQELNLENLGPFFADDVEGEFDREVMMIQQLQEAVDRSIKVDPASDTKPEELVAELFEASADAVAAAEAAKTSENNAAASATAAGNSATSAANSASAAGTSETNAATSETNASNSASAAAGSATAAGNSATAAHNSQVAAAASESAAGNSATAAGNSATAAHNSQVAAKASESAAAQSAAEAAGITYLVRKNSTAYAEGAVAFYSSVPSPLVLQCTTAGTTAATAPDFSGAVEGGTVTDGTVVWQYKKLLSGGGVAVGFIMPYAGTGLQEGWLDCDGSAVSRTMYPDLFAAIGTTWGDGDGSTTFNLPRSEDLVFQGASATNPVGTYKVAGLPNITGEIGATVQPPSQALGTNIRTVTGAFYDSMASTTSKIMYGTISGSNGVTLPTLDASLSDSIYGNSDTVQPPAACVRFMIKAFDGPTPSSAGIDLTQYAQALADAAVPAGMIIACAGDTARTGYLLCDGAAVSRTTYAALYAVIGTKYGSGDGSTTFNLPDLIGRYPQGDTTAGTMKAAGLPNITGSVNVLRGGLPSAAVGALTAGTGSSDTSPHFATSGAMGIIGLDASRSSAIYGNSDTVTPPTLTVRYMIKYA